MQHAIITTQKDYCAAIPIVSVAKKKLFQFLFCFAVFNILHHAKFVNFGHFSSREWRTVTKTNRI